MRNMGSEEIVHGPVGSTFIVRGEDDGYVTLRATLVEVARHKRKWQAVAAIHDGSVS